MKMKIALYFLGILAFALLSVALARWTGSTAVAWGIGYFTAVALTNLDRHVFKKMLVK